MNIKAGYPCSLINYTASCSDHCLLCFLSGAFCRVFHNMYFSTSFLLWYFEWIDLNQNFRWYYGFSCGGNLFKLWSFCQRCSLQVMSLCPLASPAGWSSAALCFALKSNEHRATWTIGITIVFWAPWSSQFGHASYGNILEVSQKIIPD